VGTGFVFKIKMIHDVHGPVWHALIFDEIHTKVPVCPGINAMGFDHIDVVCEIQVIVSYN